VRIDVLRRFALGLPGMVEEPYRTGDERRAFKVKKKAVGVFRLGERSLTLYIDPRVHDEVLAENPGVVTGILWGKRILPDWVRVDLRAADDGLVKELVEEAWRLRAPEKLVAELDAADGTV
jgi:hypothetical protein